VVYASKAAPRFVPLVSKTKGCVTAIGGRESRDDPHDPCSRQPASCQPQNRATDGRTAGTRGAERAGPHPRIRVHWRCVRPTSGSLRRVVTVVADAKSRHRSTGVARPPALGAVAVVAKRTSITMGLAAFRRLAGHAQCGRVCVPTRGGTCLAFIRSPGRARVALVGTQRGLVRVPLLKRLGVVRKRAPRRRAAKLPRRSLTIAPDPTGSGRGVSMLATMSGTKNQAPPQRANVRGPDTGGYISHASNQG